jgi:hypothetical protein
MVERSGKNFIIIRTSCAIAVVWFVMAGVGALERNPEYQNGLDSVMAGQLVRSYLCGCVSK